NSPVLIGPMDNFTLTPNDIGFIRKSNPDINVVPNIRNIRRDGANSRYAEYFIIGSKEITGTGVHICKSGFVTGVTCGRVRSRNANVESPTGRKEGVLVTSTKAVQGDSGGSMIQFSYNDSIPYVNAVGIVASLGNNPYDKATYCEPIRKAFEYGYALTHYLIQ
ncbi:30722_t:CDS:1, partial [Racocetra persica]